MAIDNLKSTLITNRDNLPPILSNPTLVGGKIVEAIGSVTTGAADSAGSVYKMVPVQSNARVSSIVLQCAALGTGCTINCGVYNNTADGGAAINATFFASGLDCHAALGPTDIINQSGTNTIALQEQPLWQALGLASDPGKQWDICLAVAVATAAAGLIGIKSRTVQ